MAEFAPTVEQLKAMEMFKTGESFAIEAGAGTGKTATLMLLAESTTRRGQYVAFNRALVNEAKTKMPANVAVATVHSLAMRAIGTPFQPRLRSSKRMKSSELAKVLKADPMTVTTFTGEKKQLGGPFLASLAMRGIERFCQSADPEPTHRHVPKVEGLDAPLTAERPASYAVNNAVAKAVEPVMRRAWNDLQRFDGALPFKHSHYLKMWEQSGPVIDADFILFDECQDAAPVMLSIIEQQTRAQKVFVGDSAQQIYGFTGAINALDRIREMGGETTYLSQSFRFGQEVAEVANELLDRLGTELRLTGTPTIPSTVGPLDDPDVILTRTNAAAVREVFTGIGKGLKVHLVGGGSEVTSFAKAARTLMGGGRTEHPELACFETWGEVQEYVEQDEQGEDLRLLVRLIEEFEVEKILEALDRNADERRADLVVSTAHKSKGRQWESVRLGGDFPPAEKTGADELRLLYVAVTRARLRLDVEAVSVLREDGDTPKAERMVAAPAVKPVERRAAPAPAKPTRSEYVSEVGARETFRLRVKGLFKKPGNYGEMFITELVDPDGNIFKWFGSYELDTGATYEGSWMVKDHSEYRGAKQTVVTKPNGLAKV